MPMRSIDVIDSIQIHAPATKVFNTIIDYTNTQNWFAPYQCQLVNGNTIHEGSEVKHRLAPLSFLVLSKFTRRVERIVLNQCIEESYIAGDLIGTGVWQFISKEDNINACIASYHCKVSANNSRTNFGFMLCGAQGHSLVYQQLLKKLKTHCEQ